jgi:hypothetical protein
MRFDDLLKLIGGERLDSIGTRFGLPEYGYSERANNNQPTTNTGITPQSKAAGLDKWRYEHFDKPKGGSPPVATSDPSRTLTPTSTLPTNIGGVNELELAEQARRNRINSYKAQAGNMRTSAQGAFDNILKSVNSFRDRSKTLFDNSGQEITNRASGILGQNARTAVESAGDARARGRALGLGDSSKFNLQNKVQGNLASTQGNTVARRGEENRANQGIFQERNDQAQAQEDEANTYLKGQWIELQP